MEEDKDMTDEDNEIENAEFDGGVVRMSASGPEYNNENNGIMTSEYCWKANKQVLYNRMAEQINEKLNQYVKAMQHDLVDPIVFSFPSSEVARHFYGQLKDHGWCATLDRDNKLVRVDVVSSIDKALRDEDNKDDDDDIGDGGFFADEILTLK